MCFRDKHATYGTDPQPNYRPVSEKEPATATTYNDMTYSQYQTALRKKRNQRRYVGVGAGGVGFLGGMVAGGANAYGGGGGGGGNCGGAGGCGGGGGGCGGGGG